MKHFLHCNLFAERKAERLHGHDSEHESFLIISEIIPFKESKNDKLTTSSFFYVHGCPFRDGGPQCTGPQSKGGHIQRCFFFLINRFIEVVNQ